MAGHFQSVLAASDLSGQHLLCRLYLFSLIPVYILLARFVPFAIFVCAASLLIIICLCVDCTCWLFVNLIYFCSLAFSFFFRERNPITTKFELIFLGMIGLLWLSEFPLLSP